MVSSSGLGRLGVFLSCFLAVLHLGTANQPLPPAPSTFETVQISELPLPSAGILGISPLIKPLNQTIYVTVSYPHSRYNPLGDRSSYTASVDIKFQCVQPTRRITVNANGEWQLTHVQLIDNRVVVLPEALYFNPEDETLYIDMAEELKVDFTYHLYMGIVPAVIDEDDRFGIQMFNRTHENTGQVILTTSLSGAPMTMRRFVPCFDDPTIIIPYDWELKVQHGFYGVAIATMNLRRIANSYNCDTDTARRFSFYRFTSDPMVIEATKLGIVPFSWHPENALSDPPPPECF